MSINIIHKSHVFSGDYTRIFAPQSPESPGALCHTLPFASGDITRQDFRVTLGQIFWYVTSESYDTCIMLTNIKSQ